MIGSLIAIATTIGLLVYYNVLTPYYGLIYGIAISIGTIVVEALITTVINYAISPKVSLKIDNVQLEKKTFQNIDGYLLTAIVTNSGKKIVSNLDACIQIKNEKNETTRLLNITIQERDDFIVSANSSEVAFESDKYTWIDAQNRITLGTWAQLRQGDPVKLLFPYISHPLVLFAEDPVMTSTDTYLQLQKNNSYKVTIEVKGENAERTTEHGKTSKKITP